MKILTGYNLYRISYRYQESIFKRQLTQVLPTLDDKLKFTAVGSGFLVIAISDKVLKYFEWKNLVF